MIIFNGQAYSTIIDAAGELGVSAKTIRQYIEKKDHTGASRYSFRGPRGQAFPSKNTWILQKSGSRSIEQTKYGMT